MNRAKMRAQIRSKLEERETLNMMMGRKETMGVEDVRALDRRRESATADLSAGMSTKVNSPPLNFRADTDGDGDHDAKTVTSVVKETATVVQTSVVNQVITSTLKQAVTITSLQPSQSTPLVPVVSHTSTCTTNTGIPNIATISTKPSSSTVMMTGSTPKTSSMAMAMTGSTTSPSAVMINSMMMTNVMAANGTMTAMISIGTATGLVMGDTGGSTTMTSMSSSASMGTNATASAIQAESAAVMKSNTAALVGTVFGAFAGVSLLLVLIGFFFRRWSRQTRNKEGLINLETEHIDGDLGPSFGGGGGSSFLGSRGLTPDIERSYAGLAEKYAQTSGNGDRRTGFSNAGVAGVGLQYGQQQEFGRPEYDPYASIQRMLNEPRSQNVAQASPRNGRTRDLTAAYGTRPYSDGTDSGRNSPTDYYGNILSVTNADQSSIQDRYTDSPSGGDSFRSNAVGLASNASSSIATVGAHMSPPSKKGGPMPQLPPLAVGDFGAGIPPAYTQSRGAADGKRVPVDKSAPESFQSKPQVTEGYAELARAAQVHEPVSPAIIPTLTRSDTTRTMASSVMGSYYSSDQVPVPRYQHGMPLSPLRELDTPLPTPLSRNTSGASTIPRDPTSSSNPFETSNLSTSSHNPFEISFQPARSSGGSQALPSPDDITRFSPGRNPAGGMLHPNQNQPQSAGATLANPPPSPNISLPESFTSDVSHGAMFEVMQARMFGGGGGGQVANVNGNARRDVESQNGGGGRGKDHSVYGGI